MTTTVLLFIIAFEKKKEKHVISEGKQNTNITLFGTIRGRAQLCLQGDLPCLTTLEKNTLAFYINSDVDT